MQPGSRFEVLCAGIVVADAIASQLATGGCALSTGGTGASSTRPGLEEAMAL